MAPEGVHGASQPKTPVRLWPLAKTVCGRSACLPGNPVCPSSQYLSRIDGRDRIGLRISSQFVERASLRDIDRCGLLIYTASAGAQGTLGGLVSIAPRFSEILTAALRRAEICSNDPICADHEPDGHTGDRAPHGAACHGCLLVAETSCEARNLFLDRALLAETMSGAKAAFFPKSSYLAST